MNPLTYLIVDQQRQQPENFSELLKELSQKHQLDIYQCRQRLLGRGLSLLTKDEPEQLEKISALLQTFGYTHWLTKPTKPQFAPRRIRNLQIDSDKIIFGCVKQQVCFPKGCSILAVFAEMSGTLADKSIAQLLASNAYRGRDDIRHLEEQKIFKIILQGKPILDLYLLDGQRQVVDAVRVFPGKFDPQGLGERATLSSKQNLLKILDLAKEYAKHFVLQTDFGLVNLPGCTLQRENPNDPETERKNLISLARYGWLSADLERVGEIKPAVSTETDQLAGTITAAMLLQNPTLAAGGSLDEVLPVAKELAAEINAADTEVRGSKVAAPATADPGLPAPPPAISGGQWKNPRFWLGSAGAVLVIAVIILAEATDSRLLNTIAEQGFASGAIPFVVALLMFWGSFYFIRLKRQIENTPTSRVRSIAMGMVEVKGRALRRYALISPMSHIPCVFYRLTRYRREKNNQWQVSSVSSSNNVPFLLEDDTGRVEVDPSGCRVSAGTKQEGVPGQVGLTRFNNDSDEKWCEEIIVEGTLLYVLGFAAVKRESGPTLTERKIEALRELKRNPQNLQQFDTDGDGKISVKEWDVAREAVAEKVLHESLKEKRKRKKQEEHVLIGKKKGRPLVIAETHSEAHLTRRLTLYIVPLFIGAAAATAGSIYLLLDYLK